MFSNSLVQETLLRITQRLLIELLGDLVPELLNETNAIIARKLSEGVDDLLRIHLHVTPGRDGTADDGGSPPRFVKANVMLGQRRAITRDLPSTSAGA